MLTLPLIRPKRPRDHAYVQGGVGSGISGVRIGYLIVVIAIDLDHVMVCPTDRNIGRL